MVKYRHMFKPKRLLAWLPLVSLVVPLGVSAATPQQIFGKSVDETFKKGAPLRFDATMSVKSVKTSSGKASKSEADVRLMARYRQERSGSQDSEGRLVLEKLKVEGEGDTKVLSDALSGPLAIEWKRIGTMAYLRLKTGGLPVEVQQQLGPDVTKLLGQWLSLESTDAKQATQGLETQAKQAVPVKVGGADLSSNFQAELKKLQIVKVEKAERRKNGDLAYRLRLRINPAEITKAENKRLAEIAKEKETRLAAYAKLADRDAAKDLADSAIATAKAATETARKSYAEQREDAKHIWFAATVNATRNTLERLEISGWTLDDAAATKYSAASKTRTDVKFGASFLRDGDWAVEKPANSLDLKEVVANLMAKAMQGAVEEARTDGAPVVQAPSPAVGLTHEFIETAAGYKVGYPEGWNSALGQGSFTVTSGSKEDGIPAELAVWSFDTVSGLDEDAMIQSIIGQVRDNLLLTAVEKDGWTYTLTAPEAVTAGNTLGGSVVGKSFLMTRNTDLGVIVTRIRIFPNVAGDKYLAIMFHEPLVPSAALEKARDVMLDSFTLINPVP